MSNRTKVFVLLAYIFAIAIIVGNSLAGREGMIVGLFFAIWLFVFSYWFSSSIILTIYGAHQVPETSYVNLHLLIEKLSRRAGIKKPKLYVIPSGSPNSFSTGKGPFSSVVVLSEGLLEILDEEELEGVISHEIAHIADYDVLFSTVVAALAGSISFLARLVIIGGNRSREHQESSLFTSIITFLISPISILVIQAAISENREFVADKDGALICENPDWIARALKKMESWFAGHAHEEILPSTSHMFFVHPVEEGWFAKLFLTHPSINERIRRLMEMK